MQNSLILQLLEKILVDWKNDIFKFDDSLHRQLVVMSW